MPQLPLVPEKHVITFKSWYTGDKIEIEFNADSDITEWKNVVKTIMTNATFIPELLTFLDEEYDDGYSVDDSNIDDSVKQDYYSPA